MMKVPAWFLLPALAIGFGLAWISKPAADPVAAASEPSPSTPAKIERDRPAAPTPAGEAADAARTTARTVVLGGDSTGLGPEMKEAQDRMATAMDERQRQQDEKRIAELVEALGLDAGQEAELRAFFDKRRRAMTGMWAGGGNPEEAMEAMKASKLDELLGGMLSPEQQQAYDGLKVTERTRQVEAQALRDLAGVTRVVDLRPEQRDAVYEVLQRNAGERIDRRAESGQGAMMSVMGDGVAFEMNDGLFDFTDMMGELGPTPGEEVDEAAMMGRMKEAMARKIDEQVARFDGILDEAQQAKYRESLESKTSFFDAMIEAGE